MYAGFDINNDLKFFNELPERWHSKYGNVLGGFSRLPEEEIKKHGIYPVLEKDYDPLTQIKAGVIFIEEEEVFERNILPKKKIKDLGTLKSERIEEVERMSLGQLSMTDSIVLECLEEDVEIPSDIKEKRKKIRIKRDSYIKEINKLKTKQEVLNFKIK